MTGDDSSIEASVDDSPLVKTETHPASSVGEGSNWAIDAENVEHSNEAPPRIGDSSAREPEHRRVLPEPSSEQKEIIRAVGEGKCVSIKACAGSGKTTCMLQVAASLPGTRNALIITYNRSLADECKERIGRLSLGHIARCYTIHGLASRYAGRVCNDDHKLIRQLNRWDRGLDSTPAYPLPLDLVMIDEAQDLRPIFHRVISYILGSADGGGVQLCLVGDPKQMLYDFPTYGDDKASTSFFLEPESHWGKFTQKRAWIHLPLSVSYRLTPNVATFCNLFWGTSIVGGNERSPNVPIEYLIKYPYPDTRRSGADEKLNTSALAKIIDQHGPENVMFLAQSVKKAELPIRVHVNELMKIKDVATGLQKFNFHIKENVRGFEGTPDWKNKVRVWTFCGSKGCEADVVVVFGFDMYARPHSLNQIGVALSRARKRLLVVHSKKYEGKFLRATQFYPVLGDCPIGMEQHVINFGKDNSEFIDLEIPAIEPDGQSIAKSYLERCQITKRALANFAKSGVITLDSSSSILALPETSGFEEKAVKQVYIASDFNYFSASAEAKFLKYGAWTKSGNGNESDDQGILIEEGDAFQRGRINYESSVEFATTTEDVSALYGEAVVYMLQWELCRFVPNVETIVSNGMLSLHPHTIYSEEHIRGSLRYMCCEDLSPEDEEILKEEFSGIKKGIKGKDLIPFLNDRMSIKKKKKRESLDKNGLADEITFPVKAVERKSADDDNLLTEFLPQIKSIYECEASAKKPFHWIYLANAVMAFSNYHEKFRQIGTNPDSYESWVDSEALLRGLERLRNLMKAVSPSSHHVFEDDNTKKKNEDSNESNNTLHHTSSFEHELSFEFAGADCIKEKHNGRTIVGVTGVCDWINENRTRSLKTVDENGTDDVDLIEIKFVHHLSNVHRLQVLIYTALYALNVNNIKLCKRGIDGGELHCRSDGEGIQHPLNLDQNNPIVFADDEDSCESIDVEGAKSCAKDDQFKWKIETCRGMLYNARTGETEFCTMQSRNAMDFLLDISQFKYNGKDRLDVKKERKILDAKKDINVENATSTSSGVASSRHRRIRKKRLEKNTGKSYYTSLSVDSSDNDNDISIPESLCVSIDSTTSSKVRGKKRARKCLNASDERGTCDDPIILD